MRGLQGGDGSHSSVAGYDTVKPDGYIPVLQINMLPSFAQQVLP